jgi:hypothetical protein
VFSQSVMAQLDIAAFALVLWMLYSHNRGRLWQAVIFAALAMVAKETTVAVTLTLLASALVGWCAYRWRPALAARWCQPRQTLAQCAAYLLALLPLLGWYAYHFHRTGHVFGNPDYLRYNVGATVTPLRIVLAGIMRLWHAVGYMNLFVLTAAALLLLWNARQPGAAAPSASKAGAIAPNVQLLLGLVVLAQAAEFSVVGGALLARYMIPAIRTAVEVVGRRMRRRVCGCAVLQSAVVHLAGRQPDVGQLRAHASAGGALR